MERCREAIYNSQKFERDIVQDLEEFDKTFISLSIEEQDRKIKNLQDTKELYRTSCMFVTHEAFLQLKGIEEWKLRSALIKDLSELIEKHSNKIITHNEFAEGILRLQNEYVVKQNEITDAYITQKVFQAFIDRVHRNDIQN